MKCSAFGIQLPERLLRLAALLVVMGSVLAFGAGCSNVFNPSFLALVTDPVPDSDTGTVSAITMANAPGHVPVLLLNNTTFDQSLLDFLAGEGADVSDPNLRPRIRVRVRVEFVNGAVNTIELLDGSPLVQPTIAGGDVSVPPELREFSLDNFVAVCDVARVEPTQVEVFVPTTFTTLTLVETTVGGTTSATREVLTTIPPSFVPLQVDEVDANNNVVFIRNFDIRNRPVAVPRVQCGSVVAFTVRGTLSLSFVNFGGRTLPGFLDTDVAGQASNPGRFEFLTTIR